MSEIPKHVKKIDPINLTEMVVNDNIMTVQSVIDQLQRMEYISERDADSILDLIDVQCTLGSLSQFIRKANTALTKQQQTIEKMKHKITALENA